MTDPMPTIRGILGMPEDEEVTEQKPDHADEAKYLLQKNAAISGVDAVATAVEAQVHATLALVEQQKATGALLAGILVTLNGASNGSLEDWAQDVAEEVHSALASTEIRKGMGL